MNDLPFVAQLYADQDPPEEEELPARTEDFLRWLHRWWPHECPAEGESLEAIHRYAGARSLIDALMCRQFGTDREDW